MRNHDEKIKDIIESVLPSSYRGARIDRRLIHHRERARVRAALHRVMVAVDTIDDLDDLDDCDLHYRDPASIEDMVEGRRGADNVSALER